MSALLAEITLPTFQGKVHFRNICIIIMYGFNIIADDGYFKQTLNLKYR